LIDDVGVGSGRATFYFDGMGGGLWLGILVLIPDDGERSYSFMFVNKGGKMKVVKDGETYKPKPLPHSIPLGGIYCHDKVEAA
jgi:hypothetical protein